MAGQNVPGLNETPQLSQNVPGVSLPNRREYGQVGQATEHLGEEIGAVAVTGDQIYNEITRQQDISVASKNYVDASVQHAKELQGLKLSSPDGFVHDPDTGEVIQNADGSQKTIAEQYWSYADSDFQSRQKQMSPQAAAMFRQQMLPHIGDNTKILQNDGLILQRESADQDVKISAAKLARDNDRSPYPDQNPYYSERRPDGSINLRQNTDKINGQLQTLKLWTARQGPVGSTPGMYTPGEVAKMSSQRLEDHSDQWMRSSITDIMENDTPRDHKNRVSTTAVQQVLNLRDIVEGKDPQSVQQNARGLPTVNNTLSAEKIDRWRTQLNGLLDGARRIDKSDYELQLQQMKDATRSGKYQNFDSLVRSPEFGYLLHAAGPLGLTPEAQAKDMSEIFGNAAKTAGHYGVSDLSSDSTKRSQIAQNLTSFEKGFPQWSSMLGVNFTGAMGNAIIGEAGKQAYSQLEEESKQYREDPAKFAAGMASGPQDPEHIKYRSTMMKGVEDKLYADPSLFALTKPMANGKTVIQNAISSMRTIGANGFGQGFEPNFISKDAYQAQVSKIEKSNNPELVEQMFHQLGRVAGRDAGVVIDQMVQYGKLDQRYQIAQNLPTAQARIAAYSEIMSKGAALDAYTKTEGGETAGQVWKKASQAMSGLGITDFNNRVYGADSPGAAAAQKMAQQTWASKYAAAMGVKGTTPEDAAKAATEAVTSQIPPVAQVGDKHHFLGFSFGTSGPQTPMQFSRPDFAPEQQATIQENLLNAQKLETLSKYQLAPAPIKQGTYDFNKKLTPEWVAEHPFVWKPVQTSAGPAYRLQYQGMNADGSPNGTGYWVRTKAADGSQHYYEVKESDALKKPAGK